MSRRIKLATAAVFGLLLAIPVGYLILATRVSDPLQFRLLSAPVFVDSPTFGDTDSTPFEIELRNTSAYPVVLYYMMFERRWSNGYGGGFTCVRMSGEEPEGFNRYPGMTIAGHETLRITYHPATGMVPDIAKDKPDIRYNWMPSILDKFEHGLEKCVPQIWSEESSLIEVTSTAVPLDVSNVQQTPPPP